MNDFIFNQFQREVRVIGGERGGRRGQKGREIERERGREEVKVRRGERERRG